MSKEKTQPSYQFIAFVTFEDSKKVYSFGTHDNKFHIGDAVVVETIRGLEIGTIARDCEPFYATKFELKALIRKATKADFEKDIENKKKEKEALVICEKEIEKLNLKMNLIEAEYSLDQSKLAFIYIADERVDFRELVKRLASIFKCRIELKQVGPRNKAKMVSGLGMCGMELCCSRFLKDFEGISINMAKNQLLALNTEKLSGQCGKLMCCLKFENDNYTKLREDIPKLNTRIEWNGQRYRITSLNVLLRQVKIENKEDVQFLDFDELFPNMKVIKA